MQIGLFALILGDLYTSHFFLAVAWACGKMTVWKSSPTTWATAPPPHMLGLLTVSV